jgi:hypothetical protein
MNSISTPTLVPGDQVHFLVDLTIPLDDTMSLANVAHAQRGTVVTVTQRLIDGTRDRTGASWLVDTIDDEDEQVRRFGVVRVRRGDWPEGVDRFEPYSAAWHDARDAARAAAHALGDPDERAAAFAEIERRFPRDRRRNSMHYPGEGKV